MIVTALLALVAAEHAGAATFTRTAIAPDLGLDAFTRAVTRAQVSRDLFANPYSTVTISNVDLYDRFPFVEARHFEVVSDPQWNRVVYGQLGSGVAAISDAGATLGALSAPHGLGSMSATACTWRTPATTASWCSRPRRSSTRSTWCRCSPFPA
jgi:hypothetical protein